MDAPNPSTPGLTVTGRLDRATALALVQRAADLLDQGEFGEAAETYQRVVGFDDPDVTAAALLGLGESLYRLDQEAQAMQAWQAVLALPETPATYKAWRNVAAFRVRDGDLSGAITAYREADRRAPAQDKAEIASRLGWLAKETGDRRAAGRYFSRSRGDGPAVSAAIAVLVVTVVVSFLAMSGGAGLNRALQLDKVAIAAGEYWRLVSVTLLHAGLLHLAFNMYALYLAGPIVERLYGWRWFLAFYVLCAAGGSVATFVFGSARLGVGASGAIFGLFGVLIAVTRVHRPVLDRQARAIVPQLGSIVLINLVLGFAIPGIDNLAHIGGLLAGVWLGFMVRPGQARTMPGMWQPPAGADVNGSPSFLLPIVGVAALVLVIAGGVLLGRDEWRPRGTALATEAPIAVTLAPSRSPAQDLA